jgi:hypothetical protein
MGISRRQHNLQTLPEKRKGGDGKAPHKAIDEEYY